MRRKVKNIHIAYRPQGSSVPCDVIPYDSFKLKDGVLIIVDKDSNIHLISMSEVRKAFIEKPQLT